MGPSTTFHPAGGWATTLFILSALGGPPAKARLAAAAIHIVTTAKCLTALSSRLARALACSSASAALWQRLCSGHMSNPLYRRPGVPLSFGNASDHLPPVFDHDALPGFQRSLWGVKFKIDTPIAAVVVQQTLTYLPRVENRPHAVTIMPVPGPPAQTSRSWRAPVPLILPSTTALDILAGAMSTVTANRGRRLQSAFQGLLKSRIPPLQAALVAAFSNRSYLPRPLSSLGSSGPVVVAGFSPRWWPCCGFMLFY